MAPPFDSHATLNTLRATITTYDPRRVLCLGGRFQDFDGSERLGSKERLAVAELATGREWVWIYGNDSQVPSGLCGGSVASCVALGPLILRDQAAAAAGVGEISGHFHPKASVSVAGKQLTARCFVTDGRRLIMPSFGAYTDGLNVLDPLFFELLDIDFTVWLIGRTRVHRISNRRLIHSEALRSS
jgi:uncharacterized protein